MTSVTSATSSTRATRSSGVVGSIGNHAAPVRKTANTLSTKRAERCSTRPTIAPGAGARVAQDVGQASRPLVELGIGPTHTPVGDRDPFAVARHRGRQKRTQAATSFVPSAPILGSEAREFARVGQSERSDLGGRTLRKGIERVLENSADESELARFEALGVRLPSHVPGPVRSGLDREPQVRNRDADVGIAPLDAAVAQAHVLRRWVHREDDLEQLSAARAASRTVEQGRRLAGVRRVVLQCGQYGRAKTLEELLPGGTSRQRNRDGQEVDEHSDELLGFAQGARGTGGANQNPILVGQPREGRGQSRERAQERCGTARGPGRAPTAHTVGGHDGALEVARARRAGCRGSNASTERQGVERVRQKRAPEVAFRRTVFGAPARALGLRVVAVAHRQAREARCFAGATRTIGEGQVTRDHLERPAIAGGVMGDEHELVLRNLEGARLAQLEKSATQPRLPGSEAPPCQCARCPLEFGRLVLASELRQIMPGELEGSGLEDPGARSVRGVFELRAQGVVAPDDVAESRCERIGVEPAVHA